MFVQTLNRTCSARRTGIRCSAGSVADRIRPKRSTMCAPYPRASLARGHCSRTKIVGATQARLVSSGRSSSAAVGARFALCAGCSAFKYRSTAAQRAKRNA
jgi:hypothetical protein